MCLTKFFTDPPPGKNTPVDSVGVMPEQSLFCSQFEKSVQTLAGARAGQKNFGQVRNGPHSPSWIGRTCPSISGETDVDLSRTALVEGITQ
jgi:hypothetical protein